MNMLNGQDIAAIRKKRGQSPTQFAAFLGVSENTVRRWEIGDRHPRWDMMERLNQLANENGTNGHHRKGK